VHTPLRAQYPKPRAPRVSKSLSLCASCDISVVALARASIPCTRFASILRPIKPQKPATNPPRIPTPHYRQNHQNPTTNSSRATKSRTRRIKIETFTKKETNCGCRCWSRRRCRVPPKKTLTNQPPTERNPPYHPSSRLAAPPTGSQADGYRHCFRTRHVVTQRKNITTNNGSSIFSYLWSAAYQHCTSEIFETHRSLLNLQRYLKSQDDHRIRHFLTIKYKCTRMYKTTNHNVSCIFKNTSDSRHISYILIHYILHYNYESSL